MPGVAVIFDDDTERDDEDRNLDVAADDLDDVDDEDAWLSGVSQGGLAVRSGPSETGPSVGLQELIQASWAPATASDGLRALVANSIAPSTRAAYENDWLDFAAWCHATQRLDDALQATDVTVGEYVLYQFGQHLALATIRRRLAAISFAFQLARRPSPARSDLVRRAVEGYARQRGSLQRRAAPIRLDAMRHLVTALPIVLPRLGTMRRDQLLVALGWAGALRASELVGLDVDDLSFVGDPDSGAGGLLLRIRRSKTDQAGEAEWVAVPFGSQYHGCPARLALVWTRTIRKGPLFRHVDRHGRRHGRLSASAVSRRVKALAADVLHEDPVLYSSHSLRAGFVTEARARGVADELIARHTRHARPGHRRGGILHVYDRPDDLFERPALDPSWW